jgi:hypothetical protein
MQSPLSISFLLSDFHRPLDIQSGERCLQIKRQCCSDWTEKETANLQLSQLGTDRAIEIKRKNEEALQKDSTL